MRSFIFTLLFLISGNLSAIDYDTWDGEPQTMPVPVNKGLTGKIGFGFDTIPGASAGTDVLPGFTTPNALALRYWTSERIGWDLLIGGDVTSQPGGTDAAGNPVDNTTAAFGFGLKSKYNWKRPAKWVWVQIIGRASWARLDQDVTNPVVGRIDQTTTTLNLFLGLGFEAFVPGLEALSFEASTGLGVSSINTETDGAASQSGSNVAISGDGFSPINLGIHVYF